jgi:hypothetical protein
VTAVTLRRYTNLAATIHMLQKKVITLLSPATWDDRNDAFFLAQYKKRKGVRAVLALCFAETSETYHHWRVFSHGCDGVCITFDKAALLRAVGNRVRSGLVEYRELKEVRRKLPSVEELPFLKRYPYHPEEEFRLIYVDREKSVDAKEFNVPVACIDRITLSPWMPLSLSEAVRETLWGIEGCADLAVGRSTLVENEKWKQVARGDEPD